MLMSYLSKLVWSSCLLVCLVHLTVHCSEILLHPSYHPKDLPYSNRKSKELITQIDLFTLSYAFSQADSFENAVTREKAYKWNRLLALRAFHPSAEIQYSHITARPVQKIEVDKRGICYTSLISKSHMEIVKIPRTKDSKANFEAIRTIIRSVNGAGSVRNFWQNSGNSELQMNTRLKSNLRSLNFQETLKAKKGMYCPESPKSFLQGYRLIIT